MAERSAILELWHSQRDGPAVLATVVHVEGSSYRQPGARMYIQAASYAGSISGGCLEGEVVRKASWITRNGAAVETYSTLFDDAALEDKREIPYGLGCGGVIDLLLEPVGSRETDALLRALEAAQRGESLYSATVLPSPNAPHADFARLILRPDLGQDQSVFFASAGLDAISQAHLARLALGAMQADTVTAVIQGESRSVFLEPILPAQRLVIFGAGDDVRPLVRMAELLGWRIAVADGRRSLAQPSRFPEAVQVLALNERAGNLDALQLNARDAVAILTHSFEQDLHLLGKLLPLELRYLGLLGARHRSQLLLTEVAHQLGWTPEECLQRVRAPIGLDLGGDSPEAVALTIVAEIQSVVHDKHVASRRMSEAALHAVPERPYIPAQCPLDVTGRVIDAARPGDVA